MVIFHRPASLAFVALLSLCAIRSHAADEPNVSAPHFLGAQSCASSSCHGGGSGSNQNLIWSKKDYHSTAHSILANSRSVRMAESLGIGDPAKSARCTICHSPMEAVPKARLAKDLKHPDQGVSCETCHGPAENYLLFHTRKDVSYEQRVAKGLRDLKGLYSRANACIACHHTLESDLVRAGHPEMFFELDGQVQAEPPHWTDTGEWIGPRAWLTGQAAALREMSWKLSSKRDADLLARWKALVWLLRKTELGNRMIPQSDDLVAAQSASDKLARAAAQQTWSKESAAKLLRDYASLSSDFRDSQLENNELRRRAELTVLAIDRLWTAMKTNAGASAEGVDKALVVMVEQAKQQAAFERVKFAAALQQVEVGLERMPK